MPDINDPFFQETKRERRIFMSRGIFLVKGREQGLFAGEARAIQQIFVWFKNQEMFFIENIKIFFILLINFSHLIN
jgi:hypothetical protein